MSSSAAGGGGGGCKGGKGARKGLESVNQLLMSFIGTPRSSLAIKNSPLTDDYSISNNVLGLGITGKVVECTNRKSGVKFALKVLKDNAKARREIDLHWRASGCKHIVNIVDVYENTQNAQKCLLIVMEWYVREMLSRNAKQVCSHALKEL